MGLPLNRLDPVQSGLDGTFGQPGARPFPGAVTLLERLGAAGVATAVVSASKDCAGVLAAGGLDGLFDARADGQAAAMALCGAPDPPTTWRPPPVWGPARDAPPWSGTRSPGSWPGGGAAPGW